MKVPATTLAFLVAACAALLAQVVPVSQEPHHRVVFENAHLRVLDVDIPSGTTTLEHQHDHDLLIVSTGAADTRTRAPGSNWGPVRPRRPLGETSVVEYAGQPGVHAIQNVGVDPYRLIAVENVKQQGWSVLPPVPAAGVDVLAQARSFRATRVNLRAGGPGVTSVHALPSVVVLVAGEALLTRGGGRSTTLRPTTPWSVVGAGETLTLVPRGSADTQIVNVEVR